MLRFRIASWVALLSLVAFPAMLIADVATSGRPIDVSMTVDGDGNTLTLTATTEKHGSALVDNWTGAEKLDTQLSEDGYYVSRATFEVPLEPGDYTVSYRIIMAAGKSDITWDGTGEVVITIGAGGYRAFQKE